MTADTCFLLAGVLAGGGAEDAGRAAELADHGLALRRDLRPSERAAVDRAYVAAGRGSGFR
jgi:hypothetical protein